MKKALTFLAIAILMLSLSLALVGCQQPEGEIPGGDNAENAPIIVADKLSDFVYIQEELEKISIAVETLQLWCEQMLDTGAIDRERYDAIRESL